MLSLENSISYRMHFIPLFFKKLKGFQKDVQVLYWDQTSLWYNNLASQVYILYILVIRNMFPRYSGFYNIWVTNDYDL